MAPIIYPLTLSQRVQQRDLFRADRTTLEAKLTQIREACNSKVQCEGEFPSCNKHVLAAIEEYRQYYLNPAPGRWHSELLSYREEMTAMFANEDCTLDQIHERASRELRHHLQSDLCVLNNEDSESMRAYKKAALEMLSSGRDIGEVLEYYLNEQINSIADEEVQRFIWALQEASTPEERIPLYVRYYCQPLPSDSKSMENFKAKYARQFQQGIPHDSVLESMRKEAEGSRSAGNNDLQARLVDLQMAQSAHMKSLARKAAKDQKMKNAEPSPQPIDMPCSIPDCGVRVDLEDEEYPGPIECSLCDWLSQKDETRKRYPYCTRQHAEQDFSNHDRRHHACIAESECYYNPFSAPDVQGGGICPDCMTKGQASFFCSQQCFRKNAATHRKLARCGGGDYKASLELFHASENTIPS
ncbi:hypothetical protein BP5796_02006 [Coleophoma crateriformis]|uniref:C6H2-type domain-containing protein n=1 Tax=Coleophoma crateriformis TaxID=565419 RepID=A0A3D8T215_9HELO|nr:hypothetical protein BP5796_02006 [Coleophoma crateriformis]